MTKESNNILIEKDLHKQKEKPFSQKNKNKPFCLGSFFVEKEKYTFKPIKSINWLSIRDTYSTNRLGFQLHEGDLISFGNVQFRINELKSIEEKKEPKNNVGLQKNEGTKRESVYSINQPSISAESNADNNLPTCRICLSKSNSDKNPLISPCLCSGSVKYIHLNCLKQWLSSKIEVKEYDFITMITYQKSQCELCKAPIPKKIKYQSRTINFFELNKPDNDYIIIENKAKDKDNPTTQKNFIYILKFDKLSTITIGRTNKCEISMSDVSVSRLHAAFHLERNKFYLEDLSSKFGTGVDLQYDIIFLPYKSIGIFSEKCKLVFNLKKTCLGLFRCFSSSVLKWHDYNALWESVFLKNEEDDDKGNEIDLSPNHNDKLEENKENMNSRNKKQDNPSTSRRDLITTDNATFISKKGNMMIKQESQINLLKGATTNSKGINENRNEMIRKVNKKHDKYCQSKMHYIRQSSGFKKKTSHTMNSLNQEDLFNIHDNNHMNNSNKSYDNKRLSQTILEESNKCIYIDDKNSNFVLEEPDNESIHIVNEHDLLSKRKIDPEAIKKAITNSQIEQIDDNQIINNCIEDDQSKNKPTMRCLNEIQFTLEKKKRKQK